MKIVYLVANIADISGGPRVIVEHVNRLFERGHEVEIWTISEGDRPYFNCSAPVRSLDRNQLSSPDIVVITEPNLLPQVLAHRKKRGIFLLLQHDNEWVVETNRGVGAGVYAGLTKDKRASFEDGRCEIIVVSSWLQKMVKERYGLESHVVLNGVDTNFFHHSTPLIKTPDPVALLMYDPQEWKGFNEAFLALMEVSKTVTKLKIAVVGRFMPPFPQDDGNYSSFSLPVIYYNRPDQNDLVALFSSASVFVSASWLEGFGLPGLEALACGVPLVTTDSGGIRDYAIPDETAVVVPPRDISALARGILRVLEDKTLREKLIVKGLKKAAEFNWDNSIDKLEKAFKKTKVN
jgi:glycosyltransferase involved in cell wall biosynthesis